MKSRNKLFTIIIMLFAVSVFTGCEKSEEHNMDESQHMGREIDSTHVHHYNIDVASLDVNKDGSVYQCPMDWNVISDSSGSCPICKMDLEQYSVADAQKNLKENEPMQQ